MESICWKTCPSHYQTLHLPEQILGTLSQKSQMTDNQISVDPVKLLTNLSFSHFSELIKIYDSLKRTFYEIECIKGTWGVRELRWQINSLFYERTGISQNPEKLINMVQNTVEKQNFDDVIKTHFAFEFLGLKARDIVLESDLEQAIMDNLQNFLLELGNGFCFEARQKKILIGLHRHTENFCSCFDNINPFCLNHDLLQYKKNAHKLFLYQMCSDTYFQDFRINRICTHHGKRRGCPLRQPSHITLHILPHNVVFCLNQNNQNFRYLQKVNVMAGFKSISHNLFILPLHTMV